MNYKFFFIPLILFFGTLQLKSQGNCASFVNIQQNCNEGETVDLTFDIRNNTDCSISTVIISQLDGTSKTKAVNIDPFSVSETSLSIFGLPPGGTTCFTIRLFDEEGNLCCAAIQCVKVNTLDKCCDLVAELISISCSTDEGNANGSVAIQISGGSPFLPPSDPYGTFDGNHVGNGIYEDDGLAPGTYTYTYWDSKGCEVDFTFTISSYECCEFKAEVISQVCSPEAGNSNGNVTIQVSGGTPYAPPSDPYDTFDGNHIGNGIYEDEGLAPGTYTYTYWDSNGCETDVTFTISGDPCCSFEATVLNQSCSQVGNSNGNVTIQVTGGSPFSSPSDPYQTLDGNHIGDGVYEDYDLDPGTYTYTFRDSNGCEVEVTFAILEGPDATLLNVSGCSQVGDADGNVAIQVIGGTPFNAPSDPYETFGGSYIGNGIYEDVGLAPGAYTYTYTDSNGCSDDLTFTIPDVLTVETRSTYACGEVEVIVSGGTPPYTNNYNSQQSNSGIFVFSLNPGNYVLTFTDANGCEVSLVLDEPTIALCEDFTFTESLMGNNPGTWSSGAFISGVRAKIGVLLYADVIHDVLRVEVNDVEILNLRAGSSDCGPSNDCEGNDSSNCAEFFINCCDKVEFFVDGALCDRPFTQWRLDVTCLQTWGECFREVDSGNVGVSSNEIILSMEDFVNESLQSIDSDVQSDLPRSEYLSVFPNPTNGIFHIDNSKYVIELETVRIMDVSGKVVKLENIQGIENPKVDVSALPTGLYILEIIDRKGNVFEEKLVKN